MIQLRILTIALFAMFALAASNLGGEALAAGHIPVYYEVEGRTTIVCEPEWCRGDAPATAKCDGGDEMLWTGYEQVGSAPVDAIVIGTRRPTLNSYRVDFRGTPTGEVQRVHALIMCLGRSRT
jgi:hypothetical protein